MTSFIDELRAFLKDSPLRDYQIAAVVALFEYFLTKTGNPLVAMPTGTGKSLVIAWFVRAVHHFFPSTRIMMLTHVKKLIQQNFAKLLDHWPTAPAGIYSAGLKRKEHTFPITFGGIASVVGAPDLFLPPDIIVVDEAHLVSHNGETMYRRLIAYLLNVNPKLKVIGLSATCYRMGLGSLVEGGIFTDVCFDMTGMEAFNWLIQQGYLAPLHAVRTEYQIDASNVPIKGGEYVQKALQEAVDQTDINEQALEEVARQAAQRNRWMLFASGIEHCEHLTEILAYHGIDAVAIHSKQPTELHDENFKAFELGQVRCAVSMNEMTTGVDIPEIDYIGMLRHTRSTNMWVQMLGRGTRPAPWANKLDCLVGDFTTNTRDLGPINDPVLPRKPQKKGSGSASASAPVRECSACRSWVHASIGTCPYCGHVFQSPLRIMAESEGLDVMRLADVVVERIPVLHVTYDVHHKRNKPDSMVVSYHCEGENGGDIPRRFRQYICFEHEGVAQRRAMEWWRDRCPTIEPPDTVQRAIDLSRHLRIPKRILVWTNRALPEITGYEYD